MNEDELLALIEYNHVSKFQSGINTCYLMGEDHVLFTKHGLVKVVFKSGNRTNVILLNRSSLEKDHTPDEIMKIRTMLFVIAPETP